MLDPGQYFAANTDVATAGASAYLHYQDAGRAEGRDIPKHWTSPGRFDVEGSSRL
ncbi:MAG: hypothetical protein NXI16_00460 [Alphaproteobacteria bacterium]|nr:hypothetical protein [Alphaproteobacteria bacterium]